MKCKPNSKNTKWKDKWNQYQRKLKAEFLLGKTRLRAVQRSFSGFVTGVVWLQMRWRQQQHHSQYPGLGRKSLFLAIKA